MRIIDAHLHSDPGQANPEAILQRMNSIGVDGGGVFSPEAENPIRGGGHSYEVRMKTLEDWTKGYEDRLFPILYINPLEPEAIAKARDAVSRGVVAFKIICDSFYVYDDPCMELMHECAKLDKPVMFHSGILWDGYDSSKYNRPLNWESLIMVPGLRFSLAHCAWPWTDETIALYGKFLNGYAETNFASNPNVSAEMYLDLTPGTPAIYRKELLFKLLNAGYDTPHNIIFGTDCTINNYNAAWAESWIKRDGGIMDEMGACPRIKELYFSENFKRFLGLIPKDFQHVMPVPDRADAWSLEYANATL